MSTAPQPLEVEGHAGKLRYHPLPGCEAIDEIYGPLERMQSEGVLDYFIELGTGISFDATVWDLSDGAVVMKGVLKSFDLKKPSELFAYLAGRHKVEARVETDAAGEFEWVGVMSEEAAASGLPSDVAISASLQAAWGSVKPFFTRLTSAAKVAAQKREKLSREATAAS